MNPPREQEYVFQCDGCKEVFRGNLLFRSDVSIESEHRLVHWGPGAFDECGVLVRRKAEDFAES